MSGAAARTGVLKKKKERKIYINRKRRGLPKIIIKTK